MKTRTAKRAAMTLIEVLLVVAIMAILAGLVIPNANPSILEQLRSAAGIVSADLAYARSQAVAYGSDFRVVFDRANGLYEIQHVGTNPALDNILRNPFDEDSTTPGRYVVALADLPSLGPEIRFAAVWTLDSGGVPQTRVDDVTFASLGETTRSQDTRIWLVAGSASSRETITIRVNSVTGLSTVEPPGEHAVPTEPAVATGP